MDRHEFVAARIRERDQINHDIAVLESRISLAKSRTLEAIQNLKPANQVGRGFVISDCDGGVMGYRDVVSESEQVSDEAIATRVVEVEQAKERRAALKKELAELERQDFVGPLCHRLGIPDPDKPTAA